ncbi:MAG: hypothetical protein E7456_03715 [Ruminococcaceae bacterium]|nr:hypothetical protein [Oscillospiraceae bacterium]
MKSNKNIIAIIAAVVSAAAVVTTIIVFRKQIAEGFSKVKNVIEAKIKKIKTPDEYEDFADV